MRFIAFLGIFLIPLIGFTTDGGVLRLIKLFPGITPEQARTSIVLAMFLVCLIIGTISPFQLRRCLVQREYVIFVCNLAGSIVGLLGLCLFALAYVSYLVE
jgi:hypothetical protein